MGDCTAVDGKGNMKVESHCDRPDVCSEEFLNVEGDIAREQRLELLDCLANMRGEFFQRLYDPAPVWKRYRDSELEAHFHFEKTLPVCLRWRRKVFGPLEYLVYLNEFSMPVRVGEFADSSELIPSVVRLKRLEKCHMFVGNSSQEPGAVSFEALLRTFDRKLDAIAGSLLRLFFGASLFGETLFGESPRRVVQCVAQAACELADHDPYFTREQVAGILCDIEPQ